MKKSRIVFSFLLSFSMFINVVAQESVATAHGWSVGVGANVSQAFRLLSSGSDDQVVKDILNQRNDEEKGAILVSAQLNIGKGILLGKYFELQSGIRYDRFGYSGKKTDVVFGDLVDPRKGFVYEGDPSGLKSFQKQNRYDYLSIPLQIVGKFGLKKIRLITSTGLAAGYLIRGFNYIELEDFNGNMKQTTNVDTPYTGHWNMIAFAGVGADYKINDHFSLSAMPAFNFGCLKAVDATISEKVYSYGLNVGATFQL